MPDETPASTSPETFLQSCSRLIFLARDDCLKKNSRITRDIIEKVISDQVQAFNLIPAKPVLTNTIAETIYAAYPRREGKKAALKAIAAAMRDVPSSDLLQKTMQYAKAVSKWSRHVRYKDQRDLVPFPQKWFNQGRYMDDQSAWEIGGSQKSVSDPSNPLK